MTDNGRLLFFLHLQVYIFIILHKNTCILSYLHFSRGAVRHELLSK